MRRTLPALLVLLLLSAGCSSSAEQRYASALVTVDTLNRSFVHAANAGLLDDDDILKSRKLWEAIDAQIAVLNTAYREGTLEMATVDQFFALLDTVERWLAESARRPP